MTQKKKLNFLKKSLWVSIPFLQVVWLIDCSPMAGHSCVSYKSETCNIRDIHASEIHAHDTRYLHNAYAAYAPSNPDAAFIYGNPTPEIISAAQRSENDRVSLLLLL